ncbi:uncharacterized protein PRCAT00000141001 [Priceomyces carsonii]|uniref:uncharacterized protein n=1 Tax=Priceomyces carsonii TaxID=28549 RepID=UPI002EDA2214|nr:unnamed protein product [Priceomyces carsonii]
MLKSTLRASQTIRNTRQLYLTIFKHYSIASNSSYLGDALSTDGSIPTVELAYDKHSPKGGAEDRLSPLIMLHGLFGSKANTRTISKQLASRLGRDIYCLDLRDFGDSPHIARLDYPSLAADVERFIHEQKLHKPILVGHSMGAKTAMAVALRRPDLPSIIVLVDNAPVSSHSGSTSPFSKYVNQLRLSLEKYHYSNIKDVDAQLAKVENSEQVRQFLLTNLVRGKKDDPIISRIPLSIIGDAITKGKIASWPFDPNYCKWSNGSALFIRGTNSEYVPDEYLQDIGAFFPNFEVKDIESGHWVISEKPNEFADVLIEFIERKEDI